MEESELLMCTVNFQLRKILYCVIPKLFPCLLLYFHKYLVASHQITHLHPQKFSEDCFTSNQLLCTILLSTASYGQCGQDLTEVLPTQEEKNIHCECKIITPELAGLLSPPSHSPILTPTV